MLSFLQFCISASVMAALLQVPAPLLNPAGAAVCARLFGRERGGGGRECR